MVQVPRIPVLLVEFIEWGIALATEQPADVQDVVQNVTVKASVQNATTKTSATQTSVMRRRLDPKVKDLEVVG